MPEPDTLLIKYEDFEYGRFTHVGRYGGGNQFMGYVTYAWPKFYTTQVETSDGQIVIRQHVNCFAALHRFNAAGQHVGTDVVRVEGIRNSEERDWAKLGEMIAGLGGVEFHDISVKPFRVEIGKVEHRLIYECVESDDPDDPSAKSEYVMLEPNDVMFHPPWDSGEYST